MDKNISVNKVRELLLLNRSEFVLAARYNLILCAAWKS